MKRFAIRFACFVLVSALVSLFPQAVQASPDPLPDGVTPIYTREDLEKISADGVYRLMNDLDLSDAVWTPLCTEDDPFSGELDGNGYHIYGLTVTSDGYSGLFSVICGGGVKNLSLTVTARGAICGAVCGKIGAGTVESCTVYGSVYGSFCAGGIVGQVRGEATNVSECRSFATISCGVSAERVSDTSSDESESSVIDCFAGGICGISRGDVLFSACVFAGGFAGDKQPSLFEGGIVGAACDGTEILSCVSAPEQTVYFPGAENGSFGGICAVAAGNVTVNSCLVSGVWSAWGENASVALGGIVGSVYGERTVLSEIESEVSQVEDESSDSEPTEPSRGSVIVSSCAFTGEAYLSADTARAGGICGYLSAFDGDVSVSRCEHYGIVDAVGISSCVGGICGEMVSSENGKITVFDCFAGGKVCSWQRPASENGVYAGGIVGLACSAANASVKCCVSVTDPRCDRERNCGAALGGAFSWDNGVLSIESCYALDGSDGYYHTSVAPSDVCDEEAFSTLDFESVWVLSSSQPFPRLKNGQPVSRPAGDVDGSGTLTRSDAKWIMRYLTGGAVPSDWLAFADYDGDGGVSAADAMGILREYER